MKISKFTIIILSIIISTLLVLFACDKRVVEIPDYYIYEIYANPDTIYADNNANTYSTIQAIVKDENGDPVANVEVSFKAFPVGIITGKVLTNSEGVATTNFNDNGVTGIATIEASVANSKMTVNVSIVEPPTYHIERITAEPDTIYADNDNTTYSIIEVLVWDQDNYPVENERVNFKTDLGNIIIFDDTDNAGLARVDFWDDGIPGLATIKAFVGIDSAQVQVLIEEMPIDAFIDTVFAVPDSIYADDDDATFAEIKAHIRDSLNFPIVNYPVYFQTTPAYGIVTASAATDQYGVATAKFKDNGTPGTTTVQVSIETGDTKAVQVKILEEPSITYEIYNLIAYPDTIYADNDVETYSEISASIRDAETEFPAINYPVNFQTTLGSITGSVVTNESGVATAILHDNGQIGTATVRAAITGDTKELSVPIEALPSVTYEIYDLITIPDTIYADNNINTYSEVKAYIKNAETGFPAVNYTVNFQTTLGSITGSVLTDDSGVATAFLNDSGQIGPATITAAIAGSSETINVEIVEPPAYHIVRMDAVPDTIYADYGITTSSIEVLVKDDNNYAVVNKPVSFSTNSWLGDIVSIAYTDSSGIATAIFSDIGVIGMATIEAFVSRASAKDTVWIKDVPAIDPDEFVLEINSTSINIEAVTAISARAKNVNGDFVPDGTIIIIETNKGFFQTGLEGDYLGNYIELLTVNGSVSTYFNAGTQSGIATISASISDIIKSENITIHPGSPTFMYLTPDTNVVQAGSYQTVSIEASVKDKYYNSVESGVTVNFSTTLGSIIEFDDTDDYGIAETIFSPGITAGSAQITAIADSATAHTFITVISDEVSFIEFAFAGQVDIKVQGTGGQESFEFIVNLYDMNGNFINNPDTVYFKFINAPNGTNLNNIVYWPSTDSITVISSNGQAVASISSGQNSGTASIKAYTFNSFGNEIYAIKSNIVVHAGPPNSIDISVAGHDSGINMSSGVWEIECSAILNDDYGNPVGYGTAVWFSLPDDPSWASIVAESYVGNVNINGDSLSGVAYTLLDYEGSHTNDSLMIKVEVSGTLPGQTFSDSGYVFMPIQFPIIDMIAVPQHIDWFENDPYDPDDKISTMRLTVMDGQNNPIDNQIVVFSSTLGDPLEPDPPDTGDPYTGITGVVNGEHGRLDKDVEFHRYECPPPTPAGPGTTTATVTAQLLGTQISNNVTIILFRYDYP
ncbi:MAG: hypothetical protein ISS28_00230 [Candidatus Cloacimonetes bacterium]|nr:hypothetical protein [Candidatus Cloacimonadota bacterium]